MKIEITIPVLNEEETLQKKVEEVTRFIKNNLKFDYSICIADNGSTDKTPEIAKELTENHPEVKFLRVPMRGVGAALQASWGKADADIIGCMDLDLSTGLEHLKEVEELFKEDKCDVLYASRLHKKSVVIGRKPLRSIVSHIFNFLMRAYFRTKISDSMCGFQFLKREFIGKINEKSTLTKGWFYNAEVLVVSDKLNYRVYELPVHWVDDSNSKVKIVSLSFEYLLQMFRLKKKLSEK